MTIWTKKEPRHTYLFYYHYVLQYQSGSSAVQGQRGYFSHPPQSYRTPTLLIRSSIGVQWHHNLKLLLSSTLPNIPGNQIHPLHGVRLGTMRVR